MESKHSRIGSEVDVALLPVFAPTECLLELDGIRDVAKAEIDRAHLYLVEATLDSIFPILA